MKGSANVSRLSFGLSKIGDSIKVQIIFNNLVEITLKSIQFYSF